MVASVIARAALLAATKLAAKKGVKKAVKKNLGRSPGGKGVRGGDVVTYKPPATVGGKANVQPRIASDRPVRGRALSTSTRKKSDSLDKVIKQIESGELKPTRVPRGQRKVTEEHLQNKINYRFKYGKNRWK
jgi:hypothetical protein